MARDKWQHNNEKHPLTSERAGLKGGSCRARDCTCRTWGKVRTYAQAWEITEHQLAFHICARPLLGGHVPFECDGFAAMAASLVGAQ